MLEGKLRYGRGVRLVKQTLMAILLQLVLFSAPSLGVTFKNHLQPTAGSTGVGMSPELVSESLLGARLGVSSSARVDLEEGFVTHEERRGEVLLAVTRVESVTDYLAATTGEEIKDTWLRLSKASLARRKEFGESAGLVPTIELPALRLPVVGGIIGEGGELKVGGSQRIEFGGREHFDLERVYVEGEEPSYFPELEMRQHLLVNLQGTVGQKVHVFVDHDSEAESQMRNKIKLQYKGDEDEIVQEIEAGDTQLSLPGTKLIGGPTTHRGLFGIKTMGKVGPLDVTAIASKEQGRTEESTWPGGARLDSVQVEAYEFQRWRFFYFEPDTLVDIRVFVDDCNDNNNEGTYVARYLDTQTGDTLLGNFDYKRAGTGEFYEIEQRYNVLKLRSGLTRDQSILAVSYIVRRATGEVDTVGTFDYQQVDTLSLWLLKPQFPSPSHPTWQYEMKNVYSIRSSDIIPGSFELAIFKRKPGLIDNWGENNRTYIKILGLDTDDDGKVQPWFIDEGEGLLWFPDLKPFASPALEDPDSAMYDTTDFSGDVGRKYYMRMSYKGRTAVYSLGINVIEGSEEVTVGGIQMENGTDYLIDYETGVVTFISERPFEDPNAEIKVRYQSVPFFTLASRSLLGTRAVYSFGENSRLGSSVMYRSAGRKEERPKLGEEPRRIVLGEVDGGISAEPYLFTKLVDLLPLVETEAPSRLSLTGEAAASVPNPNIVGDAYVDDMEATEVKEPLGILRSSWHFGSVPEEKDTSSFCERLNWYNPEKRLEAGDLDPLIPEDQKNDEVAVLAMVMTPDESGTSSWASLLTFLSKDGRDFSQSKFLEVWARGDSGELNIELGKNIPEDAPRRNRSGQIVGVGALDTEDENQDGRRDVGEDTGLDGVEGADGQNVPGDDGNDDYGYTPNSNDYSRVNGTEKNDALDTEDLDEYADLNTSADYLRFAISLADTAFLDTARTNAAQNGWKLFQIPLKDSSSIDTTVGNPDWQKVRYVRLWMTGFSGKDSLEIASLDIVGNRWREEPVRWFVPGTQKTPGGDEEFYIAVKNNYQHADYYPPIDPGRDSFGRKKKEQSLVLGFKDLAPNRIGGCYSFKARADDYSDYKKMRLYVHGDGVSSPVFFMRFGSDSLTYYEYKSRVEAGWNEVVISFATLVDLKEKLMELQDAGVDTSYFWEGSHAVRGALGTLPTLTDIRRMSLSILNYGGQPMSGEVWVDELRLTGVRKERGVSANLSLGLAFADLLSLDFRFNRSSAEFRSLGQEDPSFSSSTSLSGTGGLNLNKFLPEKWGVSLPLSAGYTKSTSYPKYSSGSDVVLDPQESEDQRSLNEASNLALSFAKDRSRNRFLQLTLDNLSVRSQLSRNYGSSFETIDSTETFISSASYDYSPQLKPLNLLNLLKLSYFPQQFGLSAIYARNWVRGYQRQDTLWVGTRTPRLQRNLTGEGRFSYRPHSSINTGYTLNVTRDLELEEDTTGYDLGREIGRTQRADASFSPTISSLLSPSFSFSTSYVEDHDPDRVQAPEDTVDVRNVSNQNTTSLNLTVNLSEIVSRFTSLRDESKDSIVGGPHWIAREMEKLCRKITSPTGTYSIDRQSEFYLLKERPSWEYQFGLREGIGDVEKIPWDDQTSTTKSYSVRSGMNLHPLSLTTSYAKSETEGGAIGNRTVSRSTTWPNLGLGAGPLRSFGPFKLLTDLSVSSNFLSKSDESWTVGKESEKRISHSIDFSPLLGLRGTWRKGVSSSLSTDYRVTETEDLATSNRDRSQSRGGNLSLAYSFSAPTGLPIPLLGSRIRFKSNLNTSLDLGYTETKDENLVKEEPPRSHNVRYSSTLSANYNFSQAVLGGLSAEFAQSKDKKVNRTGRDVGLRFWVEFKF